MPNSSANRFCSQCGTALPGSLAGNDSGASCDDVASVTAACVGELDPPRRGPRGRNRGCLAGVAAAIVFGRSPPSPPPGSAPRVIAVNLGTSGDGANWILTFVPVPTGLSPYNTMLTILNISGATSLPATPLAYLNASGGAAYVQGQSGGSVAV